MANEFILKDATPSTANATSYASGSWTPTANRPYLVAVLLSRGSSTDPVTPTMSGNGITWSITDATEGNNLFVSTGTLRYRLLLFKGVAGGSPSAGATTVDCGGVTHTGCAIIVAEGDANIDTATFVVQTDKNVAGAASSVAAALAAFGSASNYTFSCFAANEQSAFTHEGTELADINYATPVATLMAQFLASADTTPAATFPGPDDLGVIAVEVAISAGGTSETPTPGGGTAGGTAPVARAPSPQGGADSAGTTPAPKAATPQGGATAQGTTASALAGVTPGGATAGGTAPTDGTTVSETPTPGGAVGAGVGPGTRALQVIQGIDAGGNPVTLVLAALNPGGGTAGGQLTDPLAVAVTTFFDQPTPAGGVDTGSPGAAAYDQPTPGLVRV